MKKIFSFLFFISFGFISIVCSLTQTQFEESHWDEKTQGPIPTFRETRIEVLEMKMLPDSGEYYLYRSSDYTDRLIDVNNKLRRLYVLGFDITMAWYRPPIGGCQKPGTDGSTHRIYPEFLLVRLSKANGSLENYNFIHVDHLDYLPCPYDVEFYEPE